MGRLRQTGNQPSMETAFQVCDRDGDVCVRCGKPCIGIRGWDWSIHHRRTKAVSDEHTNLPGNLIVLCGSGTTGCHAAVHSHPEYARDFGWIVSRYCKDPTLVRVMHGSSWAYLDDAGLIHRGQPDWDGA